MLHLKNGDRITGELRGIAGELVEFKTTYAGILRIKQAEVLQIQTHDAFLLISSDGKQRKRQIDASVAVDSLKMARNNAGLILGEAAELAHEIDLSGNYSLGNTSTQVFLLTTESKLTRPEAEHVFTSRLSFDIAEGEQLKNQFNVGYKTRKFFRNKWFYAFNADGYRDPLKSIDLRLSPTLGIGHRFWDHTYGRLTTEAGIAAIYEKSDNTSQELPALSWELDFSKRMWGGRLEAFHEHQLLTAINDGFVLSSSNGLKYALIENINLNLLASFKHDTNVPEGVEKTDITYVAGVGLSF